MPYLETPTEKEQLFELGKIRESIFNFLPYVKIQEPGNLRAPYILWEHLIDFYRHLSTEQLLAVVKSKQIGISWALAIQALWEVMTKEGWKVLEISQGDTYARELLAKSQIVFNNLPEWIKGQPLYELEYSSTEKFGFKVLGSEIVTFASVETAGLGYTAGRVIHDESDFHKYYETNIGHTKVTVADSFERKLVTVSTIDYTNPDSYFQRQCKAGSGSGSPEEGTNGFKTLFYGVFSRPDRGQGFYDTLLRDNKDEAWKIEKHYPRTIQEALKPMSAVSCFREDRLDTLWDNAVEPRESRKGFIHIIQPPKVGVDYSAGVDVGEGVGLAYSVCAIIGRRGLQKELVAIIYSNILGTDLFAYEADQLCREYFNCLLGVENNAIGVAVLNKLDELGYPRLHSDVRERKQKSGAEIKGDEKLGWTTGRANKYTGIAELVVDVNDGSLDTKYKPMITEMREYQWVKGYPEPVGKTHGDTIMAFMIANEMSKRVSTPRRATMYSHGRRIW